MIVTAGCSWTYGTGVEADQTYSAYIQKLTGIKTLNMSMAGTDIDHTVWLSYYSINKFNPSVILFQLTTLDRLTISSSGKSNFIRQLYHNGNDETPWFNDGEFVRLNGFGEIKLEYITVGSYAESLDRNTLKDNTIKYLNENHVYSNYKIEKTSMQLTMLKEYAKSKNCRVIFFPWFKMPQEFNKTISPVDYRADSIVDYIGDSYYVDNGYHINELGHKKVAEEYIMPMLKDVI